MDYTRAVRQDIERYLNSIPPNQYGLATRHASYRATKVFYRWLYTEYEFDNPVSGITAPILGKPILPSLTREQVILLIEQAETARDKAIIALFTMMALYYKLRWIINWVNGGAARPLYIKFTLGYNIVTLLFWRY